MPIEEMPLVKHCSKIPIPEPRMIDMVEAMNEVRFIEEPNEP